MAARHNTIDKIRRSRGDLGLKELVSCIDHLATNRDWDRLASLLAGLDSVDRHRARRIIGCCLANVSVQSDSSHPSGLRFNLKGEIYTTPIFEKVRRLEEQGKSFRSTDLDDLMANPANTESSFDLVDELARLVRRAKNHDVSENQVIALNECKNRIAAIIRASA